MQDGKLGWYDKMRYPDSYVVDPRACFGRSRYRGEKVFIHHQILVGLLPEIEFQVKFHLLGKFLTLRDVFIWQLVSSN